MENSFFLWFCLVIHAITFAMVVINHLTYKSAGFWSWDSPDPVVFQAFGSYTTPLVIGIIGIGVGEDYMWLRWLIFVVAGLLAALHMTETEYAQYRSRLFRIVLVSVLTVILVIMTPDVPLVRKIVCSIMLVGFGVPVAGMLIGQVRHDVTQN